MAAPVGAENHWTRLAWQGGVRVVLRFPNSGGVEYDP